MSNAPGRATRDAAEHADPADGAQQTIEQSVEAASPAAGGTGVFVPLTYRLPSTSRRRNRTRSRGASFRSEPGAPGAAAEAPASSVASFGSCPSMLGIVEPGVEDLASTGTAEALEGEPVSSSSLHAVASSSAPVEGMASARPQLAPDPTLLGFSDPLVRSGSGSAHHSSAAHHSSSAAGVPHLAHVMRLTSLDSERGPVSGSLPLIPLDVHAIALPEDVFTPLFIDTCSNCAANCDCPSCVACRQQVAAAVGSAAAAANLALTTIHHHTCSKAGAAATAAVAAAVAAAASTGAPQAELTAPKASTPPAEDPSRVLAPPTPAEPPPSPPASSSTEPYVTGVPTALESSHHPRQLQQMGYAAGGAPGQVHPPTRRRHTLPRFPLAAGQAAGQARTTVVHSPPAYGGSRALPAVPGMPVAAAGYSPPAVWMFSTAPGYPPGYMYPAYGAMPPGYTMWQPQQQHQQQQQPAYSHEQLPMVPVSPGAAAGGGSSMGAAGEGWQAARPLPPAGRAPGSPAQAAAAEAAAAMSVQESGPQLIIGAAGARATAPHAGGAVPASHSPAHAGGSFGRGPPAISQGGMPGVSGSSSNTPGVEWLAPPRRSPFSSGPPPGPRGRVQLPLQQQQQQQQQGPGVEVKGYGQSGSRSGSTSVPGVGAVSSSSQSADTSSYAGARQGGIHSTTSSYGATPSSSQQQGQRWWHKLQEEGS